MLGKTWSGEEGSRGSECGGEGNWKINNWWKKVSERIEGSKIEKGGKSVERERGQWANANADAEESSFSLHLFCFCSISRGAKG